MIVTCDKCKEEVQVNMYFYDVSIGKESDPLYFAEYWERAVEARQFAQTAVQKYKGVMLDLLKLVILLNQLREEGNNEKVYNHRGASS